MATAPLRFPTPHIEELPTTQIHRAPGFAWVTTTPSDPSKDWGTTNRKRQRTTGPNGQQTSEAVSARQIREAERRVRELNSDGIAVGKGADVGVQIPKAVGGGNRVGKTTGTKKILASGKGFGHYLDDEEAEIARVGREGGEWEGGRAVPQEVRASKTPIARRKSSALAREESASNGYVESPAPLLGLPAPPPLPRDEEGDEGDEGDGDFIPALPSQAEMDALLNALPLTYNQARVVPPPANAPPPRRFCQICGYWGRVKCLKCGDMTCSVACKDAHDEHKCLKFYA